MDFRHCREISSTLTGVHFPGFMCAKFNRDDVWTASVCGKTSLKITVRKEGLLVDSTSIFGTKIAASLDLILQLSTWVTWVRYYKTTLGTGVENGLPSKSRLTPHSRTESSFDLSPDHEIIGRRCVSSTA